MSVLKIIHGYGSSGKGGALCVGLRKSFTLRKKEGVIRDFIAGEDFSIFDETTLNLLEAVPELRGDPDLNATNEGISVLWLKYPELTLIRGRQTYERLDERSYRYCSGSFEAVVRVFPDGLVEDYVGYWKAVART